MRTYLLASLLPFAQACAGCIPADDSAQIVDSFGAPVLAVAVDHIPLDAAAPKVIAFAPDATRTPATHKKTVIIKNIGLPTARPLCIANFKADSKNPQLSFQWTSSLPTSSNCPANTSIGLEPGKAAFGEVVYSSNPGVGKAEHLTITFDHDDRHRPHSPPSPVKITFGIAALGARIKLDTKDFAYLNASPANPPTACFAFGNVGDAALVFKGAKLDPANAQYDIQQNESANVGDAIDAIGTGDNPQANPKKLKVCVRYTPDHTIDNEDVKLVIVTNDPSLPHATVNLTSQIEAGSWYAKCAKFEFAGAVSGTQSATCLLHNDGPAALSINDPKEFEIVALDSSKQSEAEAVHATKMAKKNAVTDVLEPLNGASALAMGEDWHLIVMYTPPKQGKPPAAFSRLNFQQAKQPQVLALPITVE